MSDSDEGKQTDKPEAPVKETAQTEPAESKRPSTPAAMDDIMKTAKSFALLTLVAIGLAVVFLVFSLIPALAVKWWLMVPIAAVGIALSYRQMRKASALEKKVCLVVLCTLIALFTLHDIAMSHRLAARLADPAEGAEEKLDAIRKVLGD